MNDYDIVVILNTYYIPKGSNEMNFYKIVDSLNKTKAELINFKYVWKTADYKQ